MSIFMKIRPVGTELCHADKRMEGRTDIRHDKDNSRLLQFCEVA